MTVSVPAYSAIYFLLYVQGQGTQAEPSQHRQGGLIIIMSWLYQSPNESALILDCEMD